MKKEEVITDILRIHGYIIKTHQLQIKDLLSIFALPINLNNINDNLEIT